MDLERSLALAKHVARIDITGLLTVKYFASLAHGENSYQNELQDRILEILIESEIGVDEQRKLLNLLARNYEGHPKTLGYILDLGRRMSPDEFHRELTIKAIRNEPFAIELVNLLESKRLSPHGPTQVFIDAIHQGKPPKEAAKLASYR